MALPTEMKGLVLHEDNSVTLETHPFPSPTLGSITVQILATATNPNLVKMLRGADGSHQMTQPRPLIPGSNAIGRIVAVGPDATSLKVGQLVAVEPFVRGRDDPNVQILWGFMDGMSEETKKFHRDVWRDGTYAQYVRTPLENAYALNEKLLCGDVKDGGLGYSVNDLIHILPHLTAYGGLRSINLQAGETIIVSPATGLFSGAAISAAIAMGATVVGVSRSAEGLAKVKAAFPAVRTVQFTDNVEADVGAIIAAAGGPADTFIDLSPPAATGSSGVTACMLAVKSYGRIVLMGGRNDTNIPIPWPLLLYRNLTIKGGFMYEREDVRGLIKLVESGRMKLGKDNGFEIAGSFKLDEWEKCADAAVEHTGFGTIVLLTPEFS
jgi:NADPH:quinone reductase-like Zn-dependent oxidoreductase